MTAIAAGVRLLARTWETALRWREQAFEALLAQRLRWGLWLPVAFAAGIGLYFSLHDEPSAAWGVAASAAALIAIWRLRGYGVAVPAAALLASALGFLAADLRTDRVAAPVVAKRSGVVAVTGRIIRLSPGASGMRVLIDVQDVDRLPAARTPARVRISWRGTWPKGVGTGDWVRISAVLRPLPGQVAPGAFDFARYAWFRRIGALGFAVAPPEPITPPQRALELMDRWAAGLGRLRRELTARFAASMPETPAAVAAALITGERGGIPEDDIQALRDSGLAHLLAISGLHMMLVGGFAFVAIRGLLTLSERIALTRPVVKWAALAALPVAGAYLAVSGAPISAQRAFLMFTLMMIAVVLERRALSMRIVAFTAVAVLAVTPESLLEAGFQMSFAAVVALIAAYEAQGARLSRHDTAQGLDRWIGGARRIIAGIAMTTVIASTATAPFAAFHFQHTAFYALPANLAAMPLFTLLVMPFGLLAVVLMPLHLEAWPLAVMTWGIEGILGVASAVSHWPGATANFAAPPAMAVMFTALGGLWFCLWSGRLRWLGIIPLMAVPVATMMTEQPDLLIDGKGSLMAVRVEESGRYFLTRATPRFVARNWLERDGDRRTVRAAASDAPPGWRCDARGCILMRAGRPWLAHVRRSGALDEDCGTVRILISQEPVRGPCEGPDLVIGRFDLWRNGAHAVWLKADGTVRRVKTAGSRRPWSPYRTRLQRSRNSRERQTGAARAARSSVQ